MTALVALVAVAADQASKHWVLTTFDDGQRIPVVGEFLTIQLVHNSGAAFSVGSDSTLLFTVLAASIAVGIGWLSTRVRDLPTAVALGLLGGGAVGNLIDRLVRPPSVGRGHVVDFINYNGWFVGNVADIWIVVAAAWLALMYARSHGDASAEDPDSAAGRDDAESDARA